MHERMLRRHRCYCTLYHIATVEEFDHFKVLISSLLLQKSENGGGGIRRGRETDNDKNDQEIIIQIFAIAFEIKESRYFPYASVDERLWI